MTKADFVIKLAENADITTKEAQKFLAAFEDTMMNDIFANNDKVALKFGTFAGTDKETSERSALNPATKEKIVVPAKKFTHLPKFSVSKSVKESCQVK